MDFGVVGPVDNKLASTPVMLFSDPPHVKRTEISDISSLCSIVSDDSGRAPQPSPPVALMPINYTQSLLLVLTSKVK